ncbi:ABC transporter substrate-binding protein [Pelagibacterium limicola]|uniref:ABC transporter substrate-binding protein n=1 Tax=Pelagibacterium limicola TaxID=2791022 RepID=UPI0018B00F3E|nr:extracellular solute-binding protein [Pelagibacterium limicola]
MTNLRNTPQPTERPPRRNVLKQAAAGVTMLAFGMVQPAFAQGTAQLPESIAALIPAAQNEPEAVMFGLSIPADSAADFKKALDDFYGFSLNIQFQGGLGPQKAAEVAQLVNRGVPAGVDAFYAGEGTTIFLRSEGALIEEEWARELGIPEDRLVDGASVKIIDSSLPLMSYNTELVAAEDLPTSWEDLLDPKWKGKITTPKLPGGTFFFNTYSVGEEKMTEILKGIMEQDVIWVPRTPDAATRLLSGEASLALGVDIESQVIRGAPLDYVHIEPMFLAPWALNLVKGTQSPNTAKLYAYFVATDEGQAALNAATGYSTINRADSTKAQLLAQYNPGYVPQEWIRENYERLVAKYSEIMGLR